MTAEDAADKFDLIWALLRDVHGFDLLTAHMQIVVVDKDRNVTVESITLPILKEEKQ